MGCLNHRSSVSLFNTVKIALSLSLARALSRGPPPSHETLSTTGAQSCSYFWHTESWPLDRVHRRCAYDVTSKQEPELAGATTGSNSQCPRPGSATDLNRFNGRYVAGRSSGPQRRNGDSRVRSPWRRHDQAPRRFSGDMDGYTACAMEQQHRILIPAGISHRNGLAASFRLRAFMRNTANSSERSRGSQPLPFRPVGRQPFPLSWTPLMLCRGHRDAAFKYSTHKESKRNQCSDLYTAPITKPTLELLRVLNLLCPVLAALLCLESSPAEVPQGPAAEVLAALRRAPPTGKRDPASRGPKELAIRP